MKYLLLLTLLTSCAQLTPYGQLQDCMLKFADKGYSADGLIKICQNIHKKRE